MKTKNIKRLAWVDNGFKLAMHSSTILCGSHKIEFTIFINSCGQMKLIDHTSGKYYLIKSVLDGQEKAQKIFNKYCVQTLNNIYEVI